MACYYWHISHSDMYSEYVDFMTNLVYNFIVPCQEAWQIWRELYEINRDRKES